jgi:hypothetical protein
MLEEGHVLAVSPGIIPNTLQIIYIIFLLLSGGVREALFGDHNYHLIWKERRGFARVAIEAKTVNKIFSIDLKKKRICFFRQSFQCLQKTVEKQFVQCHLVVVRLSFFFKIKSYFIFKVF